MGQTTTTPAKGEVIRANITTSPSSALEVHHVPRKLLERRAAVQLRDAGAAACPATSASSAAAARPRHKQRAAVLNAPPEARRQVARVRLGQPEQRRRARRRHARVRRLEQRRGARAQALRDRVSERSGARAPLVAGQRLPRAGGVAVPQKPQQAPRGVALGLGALRLGQALPQEARVLAVVRVRVCACARVCGGRCGCGSAF